MRFRSARHSSVRVKQISSRESITRAVIETLESRQLLSVNVLTGHNDAARLGLNSNEQVLTPSNVNAASFGQLFTYPVTGQVYAQPLYLSNLSIPGAGVHNVILVATQNNDVYALDANSNTGPSAGVLWHVNLGPAAAMPNPYFANRYGPYHDINPQVGITGTPVVDLATNTLYLDAFTNDVPGQNVYSHHIHAIDITTGQDKVTPMLVSAAVKGNGVGGDGTTVTFSATQQLQRPALSLLNGTLYVTYGGFADTDPYHGWILGFSASTLQLQSVFNDTPNLLTTASNDPSGESGIWQGGAGLASDGTNLFAMIGNGDFDPTQGDYGDSFLKVTPDTSTQTNPNINGYGLKATDYFTPYNQQQLSDADEDLGSGGGMIIPTQPGSPYAHEFIGAGKQGIVYVVNMDNMGKFSSTTDNVIQKISLGNGVFSSPAYFNSSIYYHAVGDVLKRYTLTNGLLSAAPVAQTNVAYPYPGATPSISSNGTANGIVWDVQYATHGVLHAYDAGSLTELYNSDQSGSRDQLGVGVKFISPTIADGEVFVGGSGYVSVYGLLSPPAAAPAAPSNLQAVAASASTVNLSWVNNSSQQSGIKIERSNDNVNFTQIALASANATTFSDTTVTGNTTYYYRIRATNVIGDSAYSNPAVKILTPSGTAAVDLYHFDTGAGTTAIDSAGANAGTLVGTVTPQWVAPGKIGTAALSFSGDGTYLQTASQSAVKLTNDLSPVLGSTATLDVWINTTQVGNSVHWKAPAITGSEQYSGGNDINWGTLDATGRIGLWVGDSGSIYSTNPVNDGQWHNIAMTRNAVSGQVQLFVDGVLNASTTLEAGNKTSKFSMIGALTDVANDGATYMGANYFNGQLDELQIYANVLGQNEINALAVVPAAPTIQSIAAVAGPVIHLAFSNPSSYAQSMDLYRADGTGAYTKIANLAATATVYDDTAVVAGTNYSYFLRAIDAAGSSVPSNTVSVTPPLPSIVGNYTFYNNSKYDGNNGSSNLTDNTAIATDKVALLPGQTASFANVTNYSKGLNGIIIDVANMPTLPRVDDFTFKVGNDSNPANWATAPYPTFINAYPGRGFGGSTQITLIWADNAIQNEWLQVTMIAQPHLNLPADDVFYFGNAVGETGDTTTDAIVTSADVARVTAAAASSAGLTNIFDINRDGVIDATDASIVSANQSTRLTATNFISLATTSLGTPANLSAVGGPGSITLTWTAAANATGYNVYRGNSANAEAAAPLVTGISGTSFTDAISLTSGTPYYYFVTAVNPSVTTGFKESAPSLEVSSTAGAATAPLVIQAYNYNLGGEGVGYHDTDAINRGGAYRNDGVDIEGNVTAGYDVGWTFAGEWINYTISVANSGYYSFSTQVASPNNGGAFHINLDGTNVSGSLTVPNTGAWQTYGTVTTGPVLIAAGTHVMQLAFDAPLTNNNVGNFKSITISAVTGGNTAPGVPAGLTATAGPVAIGLSWTAASNAISYTVYRGTAAGAEGTTPLAAGITGTTYSDATAAIGTTYYYIVKAVNGVEGGSSSEVSAAVTSVKLNGIAIGTATSWSNKGDTITQVFDGNLSTFYDAADGSLTQWAGLDLGGPQSITQIRFAPRSGYGYRMVGGQFQASSVPDFSSNVVTLYTVTATPVAGQLTTVLVNPSSTYRYVRYVGGTQWVNIAEMEVDGVYTAPSNPNAISLTNAGFEAPALPASTFTYNATTPGWTLTGQAALVANGSGFSSPAADGNQCIALQGTSSATVGSIVQSFTATAGAYTLSMLAAQRTAYFIGSSPLQPISVVVDGIQVGLISPTSGTFASYTTPLFTLGAGLHTLTLSATLNTGDQTTFIDDVTFNTRALPTISKLSGTPIGTQTSWLGTVDTVAAVFDGSLSTYYDSANSNLTNWVGLDLGAPQLITQIKFAPRAGFEYRMVGGKFQLSTTPDFSANVQTLYTITASPVSGQLTTLTLSTGASYRYVRFVGGTQWVNIAEMEVDGAITAVPPTPAKLTGTTIGTATSYTPTTSIAQVFDGSFSSYYDAATNDLTSWVGLDLGSARTITQIKYAPRAGYEWRMINAQLQVSNTADFSSGVVTVATITVAPVAGQFTTVNVSLGAAYRYVRYVGGNQWVNIAEMEVDGL